MSLYKYHIRYIPKASLSAVIICAVIFMVEYEVVRPVWKARPLDQIPLWVAFLTCLLWKLEFGILVGAALHICLLLYSSARPKVGVKSVTKQVSTLFLNVYGTVQYNYMVTRKYIP